MSPRSALRPYIPILVCCASRDRPEKLHTAVASFCATSEIADMAIYVDADQIHEYLDAYDWKAEFGDRLMFTVDRQVGPNASLNRLYQRHKDAYEVFGVTPDDSEFRVAGWDRYVMREIDKFPGRIGVVSPAHSDGLACCYPYVSREWLDIVGWYCMPEAHSFVWDTCIELLGEATNITYAQSGEFYMAHALMQSPNQAERLKVDEHQFLSWCVVNRRNLVGRLRYAIESAKRSGKWQPTS